MVASFKNIPKSILILATLLILLNLFDAGATAFLFLRGIGYEANPIMAWLLEQGLGWFLVVKIGISALIAFLMTKIGNSRTAKIALIAALIPYTLLFIYYVVGFTFLFFFM